MRLLAPTMALALVGASCAGSAADIAETGRPAPAATSTPTGSQRDASAVDEAAEAGVDDEPTSPPTPIEVDTPTSDPTPTTPAPTPSPAPTPLPLGTPLPPAPTGTDAFAVPADDTPRPVSLAIDAIDVDEAEVIAVGVNPDETFEVPPADQVGWYRFGPRPGQAGSAVLAAHIAFDGVDGVFRHLADVDVGAVVEIGFDDGSTQRYRIETVTEYLKEELPAELFARDGEPTLALITCGGQFNRQLSSYESNVVAVAVPI